MLVEFLNSLLRISLQTIDQMLKVLSWLVVLISKPSFNNLTDSIRDSCQLLLPLSMFHMEEKMVSVKLFNNLLMHSAMSDSLKKRE
jgi:hypothetical protein